MGWYPSGVAQDATITVDGEDNDSITVSVQLLDTGGAQLKQRGSCYGYLSDDEYGDSVAGTAPDTATGGTDGLAIEIVSKKAWLFTSEEDGKFDLAIGENGADTWYLVLVLPTGKRVVSDAITFVSE